MYRKGKKGLYTELYRVNDYAHAQKESIENTLREMKVYTDLGYMTLQEVREHYLSMDEERGDAWLKFVARFADRDKDKDKVNAILAISNKKLELGNFCDDIK